MCMAKLLPSLKTLFTFCSTRQTEQACATSRSRFSSLRFSRAILFFLEPIFSRSVKHGASEAMAGEHGASEGMASLDGASQAMPSLEPFLPSLRASTPLHLPPFSPVH